MPEGEWAATTQDEFETEPAEGDPFEQMRVRAVKPKDTQESFFAKHRVALIGSAAIVLVMAIGGAVTIGLVSGRGQESGVADNPAVAAQSTPSESTSAAPSAADCSASSDGSVTTGNGPGDQQSGPGAILAFNYGYYVTRSAREAREAALPNAVNTEDDLQNFIDTQVARGTEHCLEITELEPGTYAVDLTETPPGPGAESVVYPQIITTVERDGQTYIASIKKRE
ncbi:hypothetical protein VZC37_16225 [Gordonia sp. LSe1-13]|uniref:DUF8176 domain-containing protein n=1 Tax=Gordonia sesuvii TaxID=3116777 RepID=A0ABU7MFJ7_9ACTN|nr:hypothetical protein [Gordonia sp. LSe1-13]